MLKIAYANNYRLPLPPGHRFPMEKYELLPQQLLYEGTVEEGNFFTPQLMGKAAICRTHASDYWHRLSTLTLTTKEQRRTGFPHTQNLVNREQTLIQGTLDAAIFALEYGIGMNIAGGTHHAFTDRGEGFCMLNDQAIAANELLHQQLAQKILIVDLDVHQGNGTAEIFAHEDRVFTFSIHGAKNYPGKKEKSDLDIGLADGTTDKLYLSTLDYQLKKLLDQFQPDFIFYQCGVDVLETDKLGRLALSLEGCKQRDKMVLDICHQNKIPVCCSMGGGYSPEIKTIIEAHANTYRLAQEIWF